MHDPGRHDQRGFGAVPERDASTSLVEVVAVVNRVVVVEELGLDLLDLILGAKSKQSTFRLVGPGSVGVSGLLSVLGGR